MTRHGINVTDIADEGQSEMSEVEAREMPIEEEEQEEDEPEVRKSLDEWLKSWEKKEKLSDRARRLAAFIDVA